MSFHVYRVSDYMCDTGAIAHNTISVMAGVECTGVLSPATPKALRATLSMSIYARLSAYCYHSSQDNRMTIIEPMNSQRLKTVPWFFPRKLLIHYFLHSGPLKPSYLRHLVEAVPNSLKLDSIILVWTLYRCEDHEKVVDIMDGSTKGEYSMPPTVSDCDQ